MMRVHLKRIAGEITCTFLNKKLIKKDSANDPIKIPNN